MLLNTSYKNLEITQRINEEVGKPFILSQRKKLNGILSPKLYIISGSIKIQNLLTINTNTNICRIELRPRGIIIEFRILLETYALLIPFYKLTIYKGKSDEYSFYRDTNFIKIKASQTDTIIHDFIKKIKNQKNDISPTTIEDL